MSDLNVSGREPAQGAGTVNRRKESPEQDALSRAHESPLPYEPRWSREWVFQDFRRNRHRPRTQVLLLAFRLAQAARWPFQRRPKVWALPIVLMYNFVSEWVLCVELPIKTLVGPRLTIAHGFGLVVNVDTRIGADVVLRQHVTIGNRGDSGGSPTLGDRCDVGAGAILIGPISVGSDSKIGAGSVVLTDIPHGATAVGNPARIVGRAGQ